MIPGDDEVRVTCDDTVMLITLDHPMVDGCVEMTDGQDFVSLSQKMNDRLVEIAKMKPTQSLATQQINEGNQHE